MKKIIVLLFVMMVTLSGCAKETNEELIEKFIKSVEESKSYLITGKMEITNGDETFIYNLESSYLQDNFYKVILVNETNNHEQIILRNETGVYVISPALNKSFKFDSIWPDNSSQSYLLGAIVKDIQKDDELEITTTDSGYTVKVKVDYPNNSLLEYQLIYFNENMLPEKIEVYDSNGNINILVNFTEVDLKAGLKESNFLLEDYITEDVCEEKCEENEEDCENSCSVETGTLDTALYPLYIPSNTSLVSTEKISNEYTDRVILTFAGEKNFVLVEEVTTVNSTHEIIPITGNPTLLSDTIGALSTNSMYFTRNNIDYYIVSNDLTSEEMLSIASSVDMITTVSTTK